MLKVFSIDGSRLKTVATDTEGWSQAVWADMLDPTRDEEAKIEKWIGTDVPTREEMEEIEASSRLYVQDGAYFMTATIPSSTEDDEPILLPVTFVLSKGQLVTVRYHEPRAFHIFPAHAEKAAIGCNSGPTVLLGLLEAIIDRLADVLERVSHNTETLSADIFRSSDASAKGRDRGLQDVIRALGRKENIASKMRDSLTTLQRLFGFLANALSEQNASKDEIARVKTLTRDANSLMDHCNFLSQKITFLLDATLGMIGIEQNNIIKIMSVAATVFLPPTLVASIYGMNFDIMPELKWAFGYPMALGIMVVSAVLPYLFFKRKGWL